MAAFVKGTVVVIDFPFSDLTTTKRRPALVVASLPGHDLLLREITSQPLTSADDVLLTAADFQQGSLPRPQSTIRPYHLFTLEDTLVHYQAALITPAKLAEVTQALIAVLNR